MAYRTQSEIERDKKAERRHNQSFWTGVFKLRYLLIPFCTIQFQYRFNGLLLEYYDVYVFGFRIIRLHRT